MTINGIQFSYAEDQEFSAAEVDNILNRVNLACPPPQVLGHHWSVKNVEWKEEGNFLRVKTAVSNGPSLCKQKVHFLAKKGDFCKWCCWNCQEGVGPVCHKCLGEMKNETLGELSEWMRNNFPSFHEVSGTPHASSPTFIYPSFTRDYILEQV